MLGAYDEGVVMHCKMPTMLSTTTPSVMAAEPAVSHLHSHSACDAPVTSWTRCPDFSVSTETNVPTKEAPL